MCSRIAKVHKSRLPLILLYGALAVVRFFTYRNIKVIPNGPNTSRLFKINIF